MLKVGKKEYSEEEEKEIKERIMEKVNQILNEEFNIEIKRVQLEDEEKPLPLITLTFIMEDTNKQSLGFGGMGWFPGELLAVSMFEYNQGLMNLNLHDDEEILNELIGKAKEIVKKLQNRKNQDPMYG